MANNAKLPRITMSLSKDDQVTLQKVVDSLGFSSPGQLMRILCTGDEILIDRICKAFKDAHKLFY